MSLEKKHNLTGWAFLIPAALLIFIFCFYPMIQAIILSLTKKGSGFAGLANYQRILKDKTFRQCLLNTVFYFIIQVPVMLILALGLVAFVFDTIGGVLVAKVYNLFAKQKINPMIGAAGISAFPMSGRVVNQMGLKEDPQNFLLMYSISVNVSGQIASVIAGGLILTLVS